MGVVLNDRQEQILHLLVEGLSSREIGQRLYLAESTVCHYRNQLLEILGARNVAQAVHIAHTIGLLGASVG